MNDFLRGIREIGELIFVGSAPQDAGGDVIPFNETGKDWGPGIVVRARSRTDYTKIKTPVFREAE
nr:hypothetical protein [Ardenticatena sp.]